MNETKRSIDDIQPVEQGGHVSRKGLAYQDHVAAGFVLDMLTDESVLEVWCEVHDDVTVIRSVEDTRAVEFVQVKSDEPDHLWTIPQVCRQDGGKLGSSIVERALAQDREFEEKRSFRLVTVRDVIGDLTVLKRPLEHPDRQAGGLLDTICDNVKGRLPDAQSSVLNGPEFWVRNVVWDVRESAPSLVSANLLKVLSLVDGMGEYAATDQLQVVYERVVSRVYHAACAAVLAERKLTRAAVLEWFGVILEEVLHAVSAAGPKLVEKMGRARIAADQIETAKELRRAYRTAVLQRQYLEINNRSLPYTEVAGKLSELRASLDTGELELDGPGFHSHCIQQVKAVAETLPEAIRPPSSILQGLMYDITGRCLHRFDRITA
ncbi:MAG TPA: dsDNA nuclease domain-containing protein [Dehalococcoidia bacterium]|nr:dsDNA nuclease domain-containing protein [Dehalococcoidia bacterium]